MSTQTQLMTGARAASCCSGAHMRVVTRSDSWAMAGQDVAAGKDRPRPIFPGCIFPPVQSFNRSNHWILLSWHYSTHLPIACWPKDMEIKTLFWWHNNNGEEAGRHTQGLFTRGDSISEGPRLLRCPARWCTGDYSERVRILVFLVKLGQIVTNPT